MFRVKKILAAFLCCLYVLAVAANPVLAKGSSKSGGFSTSGRSSFSSSVKVTPPAVSKGTPAGRSSFSSTPAGSGDSSVKTPVAMGDSANSKGIPPGSGAPVAGGSSFGKGFSTTKGDFSTPRSTAPPALTSDYTSEQKDIRSDRISFNGARTSYTGTWDRTAVKQEDRYPSRPQVGVYGETAEQPYYYHNQYWGLPWYSRMFFQPNYYGTGWGYNYFEPRILSWLLILLVVGVGGYFLYRYLQQRPPQ